MVAILAFLGLSGYTIYTQTSFGRVSGSSLYGEVFDFLRNNDEVRPPKPCNCTPNTAVLTVIFQVHEIVGDVNGRVCLLVDDLIDTGRTIVAAAEALKANGATGVVVAATHAVFSDPAPEILQSEFIDSVVQNQDLFLLHQRNRSAFERLAENERHQADNDDIEEQFRRVLSNPAVPLAQRVRMACAIGAVLVPMMAASDAFGDVQAGEVAGLVREAVRDLVAPPRAVEPER